MGLLTHSIFLAYLIIVLRLGCSHLDNVIANPNAIHLSVNESKHHENFKIKRQDDEVGTNKEVNNETVKPTELPRENEPTDSGDDLNIEFRIAQEGESMDPVLSLDFSDVLNATNQSKVQIPFYNRWDFRAAPEPDFDDDDIETASALWKTITVPTCIGIVVCVIILLVLLQPSGFICKIMRKPVKQEGVDEELMKKNPPQ